MRRAALLLILSGCTTQDYVPVDFQLDIADPLPAEAATVQLCVADGPTREFGAASGRYAIVGVPTNEIPSLVVAVFDADGGQIASAGPVALATIYTETEGLSCSTACPPCESNGHVPPDGAPTYTIGVRFEDE